MKRLQDIAEIAPKAKELLEAAGYFDISSLVGLSLNEITDEVIKANHVLAILEEDPTIEVVKQWLDPLQHEIGDFSDVVKTTEAVEKSDFVTSKELLSASFAIPLSQAFVETNDINVNHLLDGRVRLVSDDEAVKNTELNGEIIKSEPKEFIEEPTLDEFEDVAPENLLKDEKSLDLENLFSRDVGSTNGADLSNKMDARIDKDKILTMDTFRKEGSRVEPLKNIDSRNLTRSTRKETNEGVSPSSRRYVRGVLHKRARGFMFSVLAYLTFIFSIIAGFTLPLLIVVDKEKFHWAMFSPLLIIVGLMIYFMFTGRASCPICNQKQFTPKNCHKHRDAHKWPLFGYMIPTALHVLFYKWFKCIFCGTSVRLKE